MLKTLQEPPKDPVLSLVAAHAADENLSKIDLGIGVYKTLNGQTPVLNCVKGAEKFLLENESSKTYVALTGNAGFNRVMGELVLGGDHPLITDNCLVNIQMPGATGALRIGAELIVKASPNAKIWVSDPTWGNHHPLFYESGLQVGTYPYFDRLNHKVCFDDMVATLANDTCKGDVVLLHACCHNPTGADLTMDQWHQLTNLFLDKGLIPFVDMAYQGFGKGLQTDAQALRYIAQHVPEILIAASGSKNFGLYRERVGSLMIGLRDKSLLSKVTAETVSIARKIYSMAPSHGASIVATILQSEELYQQWQDEVATMRERINEQRKLAVSALNKACEGRHDFSFIQKQSGMFSLLGLTERQVESLIRQYSIYMVNSSRINLAGLNSINIDYFAHAIVSVLKES